MFRSPSNSLRRIARDQVRLGMFVHAFDGSWFAHPFWRPRFLIASAEQLQATLSADCDTLVIDESRGLPLVRNRAAVSVHPRLPALATASGATAPPRSADRRPPLSGEELGRQRMSAVLGRTSRAVRSLMTDVAQGQSIQSAGLVPLVAELSSAIEQHPHALAGLTRIRTKDEYTFVHSVAVSALMMALGRRLALAPEVVEELGIAGLLHDIGKMVIPDGTLKKPEALTADEVALVRTHPEQGYRILAESSDVSDTVLQVARLHHERIDGTGYPLGLTGDAMPLAVRIAAICDVFDAVTADRPYKRAWTPAEAIARMHGWHGHFDAKLLFAFMQSVGVYPPGMLVRLRSNRLGIVLDAGRRGGRAQVRVFASAIDAEPLPLADVAIGDTLAQDQIVAEEDPAAWGMADWPIISEQLLAGTGRWARRGAPACLPPAPQPA